MKEVREEKKKGERETEREGRRGVRRAGCGAAAALKCLMTEYGALGLQV